MESTRIVKLGDKVNVRTSGVVTGIEMVNGRERVQVEGVDGWNTRAWVEDVEVYEDEV